MKLGGYQEMGVASSVKMNQYETLLCFYHSLWICENNMSYICRCLFDLE